MVSYRGTLPTRTAGTGRVITMKAGGRIAFGSAVVRSTDGVVISQITADADTTLGFAMDDENEHTYDGFYEQYEVVPVAVTGTCRALVAFISNADMVAGDLLEIGAFSSSQSGTSGVLAEAGSAAGETRTTHVVAQALEEGDFGSNYYKNVDDTAAGATTTVLHTSGDMVTMGLQVGDYILLADIDGEVEVNRVAGISGETITLVIPTVGTYDQSDGDLCYRLWQKEIAIIP